MQEQEKFTTVDVRIQLAVVACNICGIAFGVPDGFLRARITSALPFLCPNGDDLKSTIVEEVKA